MLDFTVKKYSELSIDELYEILRLRSEVFVVEQNCVYQDIDNLDKKAIHIIGYEEQEIIAYTRVFKQGTYFEKASIGRVLVKESKRKLGFAHDIVAHSIKIIESIFKTSEIQISAQLYLKHFYESHGFESVGQIYLEDGIEHIEMQK